MVTGTVIIKPNNNPFGSVTKYFVCFLDTSLYGGRLTKQDFVKTGKSRESA